VTDDELPDYLIGPILRDLGFIDVLIHCAKHKGFVQEFDRLFGANLSQKGSVIELLVDQASGRMDDDLRRFVWFVKRHVWEPIKPT